MSAPKQSQIPEAPPPYALAPPTLDPRSSSPSSSQGEDVYSFLRTFDTVFLIDDSASMRGRRWSQCSRALSAIAPICTTYDTDGIDIYFLNTPIHASHKNITSAAQVSAIFDKVSPHGGTPTGQSLDAILRPYITSYERSVRPKRFPFGTKKPSTPPKPLNIIVITDGVPTDDLESPIISAAKRLDKLDAPAWQVGVQFFQVGDDVSASRHLAELDDNLSELADGEVRDLVDTVPFVPPRGSRGGIVADGRGEWNSEGATLSAEGILKVVLGAVVRRLDRVGAEGLHS